VNLSDELISNGASNQIQQGYPVTAGPEELACLHLPPSALTSRGMAAHQGHGCTRCTSYRDNRLVLNLLIDPLAISSDPAISFSTIEQTNAEEHMRDS